ncbi:hypothetical protein Pmani_000955 [Petrolisthes manimaculis]|uniref:Uncharacterized protein n=1 Tax=Petrolisthes manimaculis TaxID=1843537 RepID=A0AAE1QLG5_9EUCA|nr:hypothetical protein Pmani_010911 [Petrolisthes manimaculis]KAK4328646.1 hypothetical protein Pmani_000955 [Petrolisthes manimaculis]
MGASLEEGAPCFIQECAGTLSASKSAWYSPVSNYISRAPGKNKQTKQLSPHEPTNSKVVQANPPPNTQPETVAALPVQGLTPPPPPPPGLTGRYGHFLGVMTGLRSDVGNLLRAMEAQTMLLSGLIKDNNSSSKVVWPQPSQTPPWLSALGPQ